jgi:hypothetical protein
MAGLFENFTITRVIIHDIYKRNEDRTIQEPEYSEEIADLNADALELLRERVVNALGSQTHCLEMSIVNDDASSAFQMAAKAINAREPGFIGESKTLTLKLANAQNSRRIPGGILLIFSGKTGSANHKFLGIIKAETHNGFTKVKRGQKLSLSILNNLLLTPQQKLYKIGMFIEVQKTTSQDGGRSPEDFKSYVYDHQMDKAETRNAALYFYETFLGCQFTPTHKKLTRDFYNLTKQYINNYEADDEARYDLGGSLYTYLKVAQSDVISVDDFADSYIPEDGRDAYRSFMQQNEFPTVVINKDLSYIKTVLKRRRLTFTSKVKILVPDHSDGNLQGNLIEIAGTEEHEGKTRTIVKIAGSLEKED